MSLSLFRKAADPDAEARGVISDSLTQALDALVAIASQLHGGGSASIQEIRNAIKVTAQKLIDGVGPTNAGAPPAAEPGSDAAEKLRARVAARSRSARGGVGFAPDMSADLAARKRAGLVAKRTAELWPADLSAALVRRRREERK